MNSLVHSSPEGGASIPTEPVSAAVLAGFLSRPRYAYEHPARSPADAVRRLRYSVWKAFLWQGKGAAEVLADHGTKEGRRMLRAVERVWLALLSGGQVRLGPIAEAALYLGLVVRPSIFPSEDTTTLESPSVGTKPEGRSAPNQPGETSRG